ncbi:MAG: phytanoyl-CoA dioxygenase family protein [Acidimicrobiia bacterium]
MKLAPHPWNRDFEWPEHRGPVRVVTEQQARAYDKLGYFVLEDALDPETVRALDEEIAPFDEEALRFLESRPDGRFSIAGVDTVSIAIHLVRRSAQLRDFCAGTLFADLCHDLIGPDARLYWDQAVTKRPHGAEPVLWHQDNGYTYVEPQAYLTCWVALTDATLDNGCVWVVPGLHRRGTLAHRNTPIGYQCFEDPADAVAVPVRAGSIVVFTSLTPHATGRNSTDDVRKAYIVQYAPDGAVARRGDPSGEPGPPELQDDAERQFLVLRHGEPVTDRAAPAAGIARPPSP